MKTVTKEVFANAVLWSQSKDTYNKQGSVIVRQFRKGKKIIGFVVNWKKYYLLGIE